MKRSRVSDAIVSIREYRRPLDLEPKALPADDLAALAFAMAVSGKLATQPAE
jgi:hypothetical protein